MNVKKKMKRYNFKDHKLVLCYFINVERFNDEEIDEFIRAFARSINIPINRLIPRR